MQPGAPGPVPTFAWQPARVPEALFWAQGRHRTLTGKGVKRGAHIYAQSRQRPRPQA